MYDNPYMLSIQKTAKNTAVDPLLRHLSASIRLARTRRDLTQVQVARMSGLTRLRIVAIERGCPGVAIGAYAKAAQAVGAQLALEPYRRPVFDELAAIFNE